MGATPSSHRPTRRRLEPLGEARPRGGAHHRVGRGRFGDGNLLPRPARVGRRAPGPEIAPGSGSETAETGFLRHWLADAKKGDDDAFRRLVEATRNTLFWTIRRMVDRDALAEEILQDAYLALWGTAERVENPEAWLRRAVIRRSIDHLRREETKREHLDFDDVAPVLPSREDPAERLGTLEAEERLQRALESLPPKMRASILLRMEGYDYSEIAALLGVTESTIRNHVFQARQRLTPWLKGGDEGMR